MIALCASGTPQRFPYPASGEPVWVEDFSPPNPERGCFYFRKKKPISSLRSQIFVTKPKEAARPAANPHRISKRLSRNLQGLRFDMVNSQVSWPFSQVRWPRNRPFEPNRTRARSDQPRRHLSSHPNAPLPCASDRHCGSSDKLKMQVAACAPQARFPWRIQNRVFNLCG